MIDVNSIPSPCYVIDMQQFRRNLDIISHIQETSGAKIIPALKGFATWPVFEEFHKYNINGAAVSSLNEARLAYEEAQCKTHVYMPAYKENEIHELLPYASHITFNSMSQLKGFSPIITAKSNEISIGLRVNPEYSEVSTTLYNPCAPGSRLGVLATDLPHALPRFLEGFHMHALCESDAHAFENTLKAFEQGFAAWLEQVKWVNFGGGHLISDANYDTELLTALIKQFKSRYNVEVILEPGSAFAWKSGVLVSTVLDIVENHGQQTAMLDVSFTAHMPDCLEMPYKPTVWGARDPKPGEKGIRLGGNSCLAGDYMGNWIFEKALNIGDRVVFDDMIHYTMVKTTHFNGIRHPSIGKWDDGQFTLLREFGYEDYKHHLG